jgi:hypothetical protein
VNSPVRTWAAVKGSTLFIERSSGAYVFDADGSRFIDYVGSYGPVILGHSDPRVSEAVADQAKKGFSLRRPLRACRSVDRGDESLNLNPAQAPARGRRNPDGERSRDSNHDRRIVLLSRSLSPVTKTSFTRKMLGICRWRPKRGPQGQDSARD